jgi:high affinity Mn2+ porin
VSASFTTQSAADDQYSRLAYAPPIWTGLYVGAHLGYARGHGEGNVSGFGMQVGVQAHDSDAVGGIQIGYNWLTRGGYLVGIEADYDVFSDLNFGSVRGRFGFLANDVFVYGTAGLAFADSGPDNVVGLVIGAGAEIPVWRNTTVGLEALYYNFEEQSGTINTGFGTVRYSADADSFVIRGRLNYHFK